MRWSDLLPGFLFLKSVENIEQKAFDNSNFFDLNCMKLAKENSTIPKNSQKLQKCPKKSQNSKKFPENVQTWLDRDAISI